MQELEDCTHKQLFSVVFVCMGYEALDTTLRETWVLAGENDWALHKYFMYS